MIPLLIARNTFREATRDRVLVGMLIAGGLVLLASYGLGPLAMGEGRRLTVDLGLSGISLLGLLTLVLVGSSLVAKEIERRTIYNLLSRPISRSAYLVGKWAGMTAALWLVAAVLGSALWGLLLLRGLDPPAAALLQAVYLTGLELMLVTALAVLFSALSTPVLSALYLIGFYVAGQWSYDLRAFAGRFPAGISPVLESAANLLPNLPLFNMRSLAADGGLTSAYHLVIASAYAIVYCACALGLAAAAFESKDFK